jgi:YD repeat-containing protein
MFALVAGTAPLLAQGQPGQPPSQPGQPPSAPTERARPAEQAKAAQIQGDLVNVDAAKRLITVKVADGSEMEFTYNDKTEVTGAKDGVAGLATAKDSRVTVHFNDDPGAKAKLATRIIVQPKG